GFLTHDQNHQHASTNTAMKMTISRPHINEVLTLGLTGFCHWSGSPPMYLVFRVTVTDGVRRRSLPMPAIDRDHPEMRARSWFAAPAWKIARIEPVYEGKFP